MSDISSVIKGELLRDGADIVRFVDISALPTELTLGYHRAVLMCVALSKQFILEIYNDAPTQTDEFLDKEDQIEAMADMLAERLRAQGYRAHSQSEKNNAAVGYIEQAYISPELQQGISALPQKAIARIAGLGFIGKNNLLVTADYGCGIAMCSVLTNAPIVCENSGEISPKCGGCTACVDVCAANALQGNEWTLQGGRESVVDVSKCCCALKCMVVCPWTRRYASK